MNFVARFFLLAMVTGFAELYLLIEVAARFSFLTTAAACVFTGVVGGSLVRHQGMATLAKTQEAMQRGELPAEHIVGGVMLLTVGATLILPGFISDAVGFLLLIPPLRSRAARWLVRYFKARGLAAHVGPFPGPTQGFGPGPGPGQEPLKGEVIDIQRDQDKED